MTGQRFGRLQVLYRADNKIQACGHSTVMWRCLCDCGVIKDIDSGSIRSGHTRSCGCLHDEAAKYSHRIHGKKGTRLYRIYQGMMNRCNNPNQPAYKNYGSRGIRVCEQWIEDFMSFYNWAMTHGYSDDLTLDRIDVNVGYSPENCRWISRKEQSLNRTDNHIVEFNGEAHPITEWAQMNGLTYPAISKRLKRGWPVEYALTLPLKSKLKDYISEEVVNG